MVNVHRAPDRCQKEHVAHVEPNQVVPERFWLTCGGEQFAEWVVETIPSMDETAHWFNQRMNEHLNLNQPTKEKQ